MWWEAIVFASEPARLGVPAPDDARQVSLVRKNGSDPFLLLARTVSWEGVPAKETLHVTLGGLVYAADWWISLPTDKQRTSFLAAIESTAGSTPCPGELPAGTRAFLTHGGAAYVVAEVPGGVKAQAQVWRGDCEALVTGLDAYQLPRIQAPEKQGLPHEAPLTLVESEGPPPIFTGPESLVALADRYWKAGIACTGRQPAHWSRVPIVEDADVLPYAGLAHSERGALHTIRLAHIDRGQDRLLASELNPDPEVVVTLGYVDGTVEEDLRLAHEIAHAWNGHPSDPMLREGLTELLAHCIVGSPPVANVHLPFDGEPLASDNVTMWWSEYQRSLELVRRAADIVPASVLWSGGPQTWPWFWSSLTGSGASREQLDYVVAAYPGASGLDADGDGLPLSAETTLGTDPWLWDSDGDGWWDGAKRTPGAVPLPSHGAFACIGVVRKGRAHASLTLEAVGTELGVVTWRIDGELSDELPERLAPGTVVYASFEAEPGVPYQAWLRSGDLGPCP